VRAAEVTHIVMAANCVLRGLKFSSNA